MTMYTHVARNVSVFIRYTLIFVEPTKLMYNRIACMKKITLPALL